MKPCLVCGENNFKKVFDCGDIYQSQYIDKHEQKQLTPIRTTLFECQNCKMVQFDDFLNPDSMYRKYFYRSGANSSMVNSLKDIVNNICKYVAYDNHGLNFLDIGCNDGTLLDLVKSRFYKFPFLVGIDPANNLAEHTSKKCNIFINNYFDSSFYFQNKFDVITSIAMFYDVPNPNQFIQDVKKNLSSRGIWIVQMTDIMSMFNSMAFDNICHEHIGYYSIQTFNKLIAQNDMQIIDISYNDVNGGSARFVISHNNVYTPSKEVNRYLNIEKNLFSLVNWETFEKRLKSIKNTVLEFISSKDVYAIGASTKGNTLLQMFGLDNSKIKGVLEISPDKIGKYTVSSLIPIISEEEGFSQNPEYLLVLPWHFIENFKKKYVDFLEKGGKFIVPLPIPMVVSKDGEVEL